MKKYHGLGIYNENRPEKENKKKQKNPDDLGCVREPASLQQTVSGHISKRF